MALRVAIANRSPGILLPRAHHFQKVLKHALPQAISVAIHKRRFYSMPRILRRVCSNLLQRCAPLISFVGNLSYRSNIRVDYEACADFKRQRARTHSEIDSILPAPTC